jgi:predicted nucleotidyltransferase
MRPKASLPPETSPARLLMGDYHLKLLSLLYLRPTEDFHLREVERLTGVPSGPANRELRRFQHAGLVTSRRSGNQVRYQADRSCVIFDELAAILRKTTGLADVIRAALEPLQEKIELALLFGSSASGKEGPYSDIDLLVIGTVTFDEIVLALSNAQATLGRPINPVILKPREFSTKRDKGDAFLKRVLAEPKIVLLGSLDEPR